jgi:acetyl esterase/lipase
MDLDHTTYTITTNAPTDYLPLDELLEANDWYASEERRLDPEASPIRADLTGFPPMLVLVGGAEMMLGDSLRLADNAARDGVDLDLFIEPEMPHVWPALVPWEAASKRTLRKCAEWIPGVVG